MNLFTAPDPSAAPIIILSQIRPKIEETQFGDKTIPYLSAGELEFECAFPVPKCVLERTASLIRQHRLQRYEVSVVFNFRKEKSGTNKWLCQTHLEYHPILDDFGDPKEEELLPYMIKYTEVFPSIIDDLMSFITTFLRDEECGIGALFQIWRPGLALTPEIKKTINYLVDDFGTKRYGFPLDRRQRLAQLEKKGSI